MPTLNITQTYATGNVLNKVDLDNICTSLTTFVNSTKLDSSNVQTGGLIGANLANATVTETQLAASIAGAGLTGGAGTALAVNVDGTTIAITSDTLQIPSSVNLLGKAVQENGKNVLVSNTNATNSLALIRGRIASGGTVSSGEGFSVSRTGTGQYTVTFSSAFADNAIPVANAEGGSLFALVFSASTTSFNVLLRVSTTGASADGDFNFIAVGQRA